MSRNAQSERSLPVFLIIAIAFAASPAALAKDSQAMGRQLFASHCASCHGASGRPDANSPVVQALGAMPADFSDPLFNSREPANDWEMVITHGGQAMGLAPQMPAQGEALSAEQVSAVTGYIKSLADTRDYPPGEMNLFLPVRTKKAFPEDEVVYVGRFTDQPGENAWKNVFEVEKRFGKRGQGVLEIIHEAQGSSSEISEVELGYKHALSFSKQHIWSGAAVVAIPVEAEGDGELQTYLAYGRRMSSNWILQSSLRFKFPFDSFGDGEVELAGVVHYAHSPWPRNVFPALEMTVTRPYDSANGDTEWTALPQVRFGLTRGGHVALNLGLEIPLSDQSWDERYYLTLLWDFADGSFFKGW